MTARRLLACLVLLPALLVLTGCAALRPDHVSVFVERDAAETEGSGRSSRTTTSKAGLSATYDLHKR